MRTRTTLLLLLLAACGRRTAIETEAGAAATISPGPIASSATASLDLSAYRALAEHPRDHKPTSIQKQAGLEPQTAFTFNAPGLPRENLDVQSFDRHPDAWSFLLLETTAQPSQFGTLTKLFEQTFPKGTATWYRITDGPLSGCYLDWQDGVAKNITVDSLDFVVDDDEPSERALGVWLAEHPSRKRDGG